MTTCKICPHYCSLENSQIGKCNVRSCQNNEIQLDRYGLIANLAVEPIEKRPLFHFYPGTKFLSVGGHGCQLSCKFCQNFKISQNLSDSYKKINPAELITLAKTKSSGICFTYNEPTIYYEYLIDVGKENHNCLPLSIKSNGFVNLPIVDHLNRYFNAWNIDIKGDDTEYQRIAGGFLRPVMECIEFISSQNIHLEISYLVVPSCVKNTKFHCYIRDWLYSLSKYIPVHVLYFYPFHLMTDESYAPAELLPVLNVFKEKMEYVYLSNYFDAEYLKYKNTYCKTCSCDMIKRTSGVNVLKLECCGEKIQGVFT